MELFHPVRQQIYSEAPERCYFGTAPTLTSINSEYGKGTAEEWLTYQLAAVAEFCGARDKLSRMQMDELARIIARKYNWLNVAELMLFCQRLKEGEYGIFYGSIDPQKILVALSSRFLPERYHAYEIHEQEKRERRQEKNKKESITYEQYLEMKKQGLIKNI